MNKVKFITLSSEKFAASWGSSYDASKYQGIFVHLTDAFEETKTVAGDDEDEVEITVNHPAGLYFGGVSGWEMLTNDTDVAAIEKAIKDAIEALDTTADVVVASVSEGVVTLTKAVKEEDGIISAVDGESATIDLAKVATTGAAADVSAEAIEEGDDTVAIESTTVAGQLAELAKAVKTEEIARVDAIEALDTEDDVVVASVSEGVVTLTKAVKEEDGIISAVEGEGSTITLAKVATTGAAEDIKFAQYPSELAEGESAKIAADATLQEVMEDVIDSINQANADAVLALYDSSDNVLEGDDATVKADGTTYTLKQGTGETASVIAKFNIVKDSFVKSGEVVYGTLEDGEFVPSETPASDGSDAFIKLVLTTNNGSGSEDETEKSIYIPASSLIEYSQVDTDDLYLSYNGDTHIISVKDKVKDAIKKVEGLTVNGQVVDADGKVTIDADDIIYGDTGSEDVTVGDALDALDARLDDLEAVDAVVTTVAGADDESDALENTGVNVVVKVADNAEEDSNDHAYVVSATAEMVWLTELPA